VFTTLLAVLFFLVGMPPNHAVNTNAHRRRFAPWWSPLLLGLTSAIWPERIVAMCQSLRQNGSWFSGGALYATPRRARLTGIALCLVGAICLAPFTDAIFHS
jgi:hypothetical protein